MFVFPVMIVIDSIANSASGDGPNGGGIVLAIILAVFIGYRIAFKYSPERVEARRQKRLQRHQRFCSICRHNHAVYEACEHSEESPP